ncbi:phosphatases II [Cutaneotrichosporon oleaginosum]|uniref:Phosphatases II n=1 Tax=Cutaneotrichosporon oleaginosum TaxID=879819 RepID=A0A0J0XZX4_9TREE|nr:phosphatases II [Cutaneotrichosporon oleaginosum]KLT46571.1 phosphatases II [Cutaneotrichosporon oleaginosum]TXT15064.1 hypothetical protein COLE_01257 [Cutaneotrichosporon oleaginosum]
MSIPLSVLAPAAPSPTLTPPVGPWVPSEPPSDMHVQEWKYEMRREAQAILPNLFLGPFQASTNLGRLREKRITHILCLRDSVEARLIYPRFPTEFVYLTLDVADSDGQNIISIFPRCREFIDMAMDAGGAVLVHCNSGIATAPAIVMGYLMWKFGWDYLLALTFVQSKRYCVAPASFEAQLREYTAIAQAHKALPAGSRSGIGDHKRALEQDNEEGAPPRGASKRRLTDDEDDVEME